MSAPSDSLLTITGQALERLVPEDSPLCVAYSGGLDSTVLLHLLAQLRPSRVRAIHVNHGLQPEADTWAEHCAAVCAGLGIDLSVLTVSLQDAAGESLEALAREARYQALKNALHEGEWLVTGQHQQDQLETMLLALLRGAGVHGLAAMPEKGRVLGCPVLRPLLEIGQEQLVTWAREHDLHWIEDPSNADTDFDRNYLRHAVLPPLLHRWPSAARSASRSARHCAAAMRAVDARAGTQLQEISDRDCLSAEALQTLETDDRRAVFRAHCRQRGLPVPDERQLDAALAVLLTERSDAEPLAAWPGARLRRYRGYIWSYPESADPGADDSSAAAVIWDGRGVLSLGPLRGRLELRPGDGAGLNPDIIDAGGERMSVRFRDGGEKIRPGSDASRRPFKKLLQEKGVLPWMRSNIPLLYIDGELAAAGDEWLNFDHPAIVSSGGMSVEWQPESPWFSPFQR